MSGWWSGFKPYFPIYYLWSLLRQGIYFISDSAFLDVFFIICLFYCMYIFACMYVYVGVSDLGVIDSVNCHVGAGIEPESF